jgi:hypothetical protein
MKKTLHPSSIVPISVGVSALIIGAIHFSGNTQSRSQIIYQALMAVGSGGAVWLTFGDAIQKQRQLEQGESPAPSLPDLGTSIAESTTVQTTATPVQPALASVPEPAAVFAGNNEESPWDDEEESMASFGFNIGGM